MSFLRLHAELSRLLGARVLPAARPGMQRGHVATGEQPPQPDRNLGDPDRALPAGLPTP